MNLCKIKLSPVGLIHSIQVCRTLVTFGSPWSLSRITKKYLFPSNEDIFRIKNKMLIKLRISYTNTCLGFSLDV